MTGSGLRVIAGRFKGQRLKALAGFQMRPTIAKVKGSIFSSLGEWLEGAAVLDLFAGSGNLGIEALSRGAGRALFVDRSLQATRLIGENLQRLRLLDQAEIWLEDVFRALGRLHRGGRRFDLIFADPPYGTDLPSRALFAISTQVVLGEGGRLVIEHSARAPLPERVGRLTLSRRRRFGDTMVSVYSVATDDLTKGGEA